jgi:hypothetical protein
MKPSYSSKLLLLAILAATLSSCANHSDVMVGQPLNEDTRKAAVETRLPSDHKPVAVPGMK